MGEDTGTPVNLSYDVPFRFRFTGTLGKVTIDLKRSVECVGPMIAAERRFALHHNLGSAT